jgi:hypothetical protein
MPCDTSRRYLAVRGVWREEKARRGGERREEIG